MTSGMDREAVPEPLNPLGIDGIEFIEFATSKPQAMGGVLETMGFRPIARHRSREVELYRQGTMNVIVNSQAADVPRTVQPVERPVMVAEDGHDHDALRVAIEGLLGNRVGLRRRTIKGVDQAAVDAARKEPCEILPLVHEQVR